MDKTATQVNEEQEAAEVERRFLRDMQAEGYTFVRKLPSGEYAGLFKFIATTGLVVGLNEFNFRTRFCYDYISDAFDALQQWDGYGDPPGPWIKQKGLGIDRSNPKTFQGIPIVTHVAIVEEDQADNAHLGEEVEDVECDEELDDDA